MHILNFKFHKPTIYFIGILSILMAGILFQLNQPQYWAKKRIMMNSFSRMQIP